MRTLTALTIASALALPGLVSAQQTTAAAAGAESRVGPQIELTPDVADFGQIDDSKVVEQVIKLTNTGDEVLRIPEEDGVTGSCGCTVPRLSKYVLEPGESVDLTVRFDPRNRQDHQKKTVTIRTEGSSATTVLPVDAFVVQRVQVVEGVAHFGNVDQGDEAKVQIHVRGMGPDFKVTNATTNREDAFSVEILGTEIVQREDPLSGELVDVGETTIELSISPDAPVGRIDARLVLETNDEIAIEKEVRVAAAVRGDVRLEPAVIRLGALQPGGSFEQSIAVFSNRDKPFAIDRVLFVTSDLSEADKALIETSFEPLPEDDGRVGYTVTVSGQVSDTMRIIRGKLVVVTDAPSQRVISSNIAGVVQTR